ncbi:DUF1588 domain-containing protein [Rubripirellula sp.]|nr:DUF1588 domain-containing protein [Rubripirellula sp.]MDB4749391.1 DUF1588 domain-containing protein [Rubripirellula sp.]
MRHLFLLFCLLTLFGPDQCCSVCPAQTGVPATTKTQPAQGKAVIGLLKEHCSDCHASTEASGDFRIDGLQGNVTPDTTESWSKVFRALVTNQMPPSDAEPIGRGQKIQAVDWLEDQLQDSAVIKEWQQKMLHPEYGNFIEHNSLFDGTVKTSAWSPSRLWKKSPAMFNSMTNRGMGFRAGQNGSASTELTKLKQPFTIEDKAGLRDFAAITFADSATLSTMLRNAETFVDRHLAGTMHQLRVQRDGPIPEDQLPKDKKGNPIRPRFPATPPEFETILLAESAPTDDQIAAAITRMFQWVIEREPSVAELDKYRALCRECTEKGGNAQGLRTTLLAIAVSPPAVYRAELGQGPVDQHGRQLLSPANLAFSISYSLTDQKPDESLMSAAINGKLRTPEDAKREVIRYWDDPNIAKPRILRFFHEFFGYNAAPGVFKDTARFGKDYRKVPERLVDDADTLVMHLVNRDRDVLAELLTTDKYFVSHSGDNEYEREIHDALQAFYDYYKDKPWRDFPYKVPEQHTAHVRSIHKLFRHANGNVTKRWMKYLEQCDRAGISHMPLGGTRSSGRDYIHTYNLDEKSFSFPVEQPFPLAAESRIGILMHPAWLIAHSLNLDNDPVRRGKWIRERLLADTVPELPITVDASIPEDHHKSLRERFAVTRNAECWRCHVKMNPLGMPFESFDDFGRYRQHEKLIAKGETRPVDSRGNLSGTENSELDGAVRDPVELMHRLAKSSRVRQSFVRHAFRYWMGRNEMQSDSTTLRTADLAYVESGGSFRAMVISLLTSDSFLYRKSLPEQNITVAHSPSGTP